MPPAAFSPELTRTVRRSETADPASTRAAAPAARGRGRRGPFRPEVWLNARQRHTSRLAAHYFRAVDALAVIAVTVAGLALTSPAPLPATPLSQAGPLVIAAVLILALIKSLGLYRFPRGQSVGRHLAAVAAVVGIGALAGAVGMLGGDPGSLRAYSLWAVAAAATLCGLHAIWSLLVRKWRRNGALTPAIVIVGATRQAQRLIESALERRDLNILGVFDDRLARSPDNLAGVPVLGDAEALIGHRITPYVDRIVLAVDPAAQARVRALTERLRALPNELTLLVDQDGHDGHDEALEALARAPLAPLDGADPDRRAFNKRLQDLVLGSVALLALSPLMALIAVAVRLDSPGPIFFRQRRHGFIHEEIVVWKFRTMRHASADATASRQVTHDDDRITRIGRFLRSTSLDELPQLINVLAGEMSLVGPRPHAIGMKTGDVESARLVAEYAERHRIKPGMTGWAAVKGSRGPLHSAADVRRRVQLDVEYIERQSFWLDVRIMAVTVPVLLGDRVAVR